MHGRKTSQNTKVKDLKGGTYILSSAKGEGQVMALEDIEQLRSIYQLLDIEGETSQGPKERG
jgi:hypothetical protein